MYELKETPAATPLEISDRGTVVTGYVYVGVLLPKGRPELQKFGSPGFVGLAVSKFGF